jgi:hypothetical protein
MWAERAALSSGKMPLNGLYQSLENSTLVRDSEVDERAERDAGLIGLPF